MFAKVNKTNKNKTESLQTRYVYKRKQNSKFINTLWLQNKTKSLQTRYIYKRKQKQKGLQTSYV